MHSRHAAFKHRLEEDELQVDEPIRLATDGDDLERLYWPEFIRDEFPTFEKFWLRFVVPLTTRDIDRSHPRLRTEQSWRNLNPRNVS
jgi:hypothetical protein